MGIRWRCEASKLVARIVWSLNNEDFEAWKLVGARLVSPLFEINYWEGRLYLRTAAGVPCDGKASQVPLPFHRRWHLRRAACARVCREARSILMGPDEEVTDG